MGRRDGEVHLRNVRGQDVRRELVPLLAPPPPEVGELDRLEAHRVPISMRNNRGNVAPRRAGNGARRPSSSARSHAMIALRTSPPPRRLSGSGRQRRDSPRRQRQGRPLVVAAERKRGEDLSTEPARSNAVSRVAEAVVDTTLARHRSEEREVVGRYVDRPSPRVLDACVCKTRKQSPQPALGTRRGRQIRGEALVDSPPKTDRPRTTAHQHAPVARCAEVVQEHPPVDDCLAPGPADLLEQLRHWLGQDDVGAEVRHVPRHRAPA